MNKSNLHIFLINSPIILCIALGFIQANNDILPNCRIIMSRRQFIPLFLQRRIIFSFHSQFTEILFTLFRHLFSYFILSYASKSFKIKPFVFYCSQNSNLVKSFINHPQCVGIRYLEEGQLSFKKNVSSYDPSSHYLIPPIPHSANNLIPLYDKKADLFLCSHPNSFPLIQMRYKYIVNIANLDSSWYKPITTKNTSIILLPSRARLSYSDWLLLPAFIHTLFKTNYSVKFHPSFCYSYRLTQRIKARFKQLSTPTKQVTFLSNECILELEMLAHTLHIKGPQSSLETYASLFGSKYERIVIPGWIFRQDRDAI